MSELFGGFSRKVLVSATGSIAAASSVDFGVFQVGQFARLTGLIKVDSVNNNTANLQFRFQAQSGTTIVTSNLAVTSGGLEINVTNPSNLVGLGITPVQSETIYSALVFGELVR